jgi:hypothetical protein
MRIAVDPVERVPGAFREQGGRAVLRPLLASPVINIKPKYFGLDLFEIDPS